MGEEPVARAWVELYRALSDPDVDVREKTLRECVAVGLRCGDADLQFDALALLGQLLVAHAGPEAISLLSTYWSCGDVDTLRAQFRSAGLPDATVTTRLGTARFPSVDAFAATEVESTPLIDRIGDGVLRAIQDDARSALQEFVRPDGRIDAPIECHVVTARKP